MAGVACAKCGKPLDMTTRAAGISVFQHGDERAVAVIARCRTPFDKWCECEAHKEYEKGG